MKIFILASLMLCHFTYADEALETNSFDTINKKIKQLNKKHGKENVLVVFDIDNTVLAMPNNFGSDQWFTWQNKECLNRKSGGKYCVTSSFPELLDLQGQIFATSDMQLTEPSVKTVIKELQKNNQSVILLTSRGPEFRNATMRSLEQQGLNFDKSAIAGAIPGKFKPYNLDDLAKDGLTAEDVKIASLGRPRSVSYMNGVSMNAGQNKGIMLKTLIHRSGQKFKAIVFADDHVRHTIRMQEIFGKRDPIEAVTYRYSKIDPIVEKFKASDKSEEHRSYEAFTWGKKQAFSK